MRKPKQQKAEGAAQSHGLINDQDRNPHTLDPEPMPVTTTVPLENGGQQNESGMGPQTRGP